MTQQEQIKHMKELLAEAKEALMNRDPHTRAKECYDSGHTPCECTLCKINEALKEERVVIKKGATAHSSKPTISPEGYKEFDAKKHVMNFEDLSEAIAGLIKETEKVLEINSGMIWSDHRERIYKAIAKARSFITIKS